MCDLIEKFVQVVGRCHLVRFTHWRGRYVNGFHNQLLQSGGSALACEPSLENLTQPTMFGQTKPRPLPSRQYNQESMSETLDPLSDRACRMTHAYKTGIELTETLRDGTCLCAAVSGVTPYTEHLKDGYPDWHPAPDLFEGMLRLVIY